jgi:hypothetical protein
MFQEIENVASVLSRIHHTDAEFAMRSLDAIERALEAISEAARPAGVVSWNGAPIEPWASRVADALRGVKHV